MQSNSSNTEKESSTVKLSDFSVEGFIVEMKAELETPHNPLIFLNILEESRGLVAVNLVFDPQSLRKIGWKLLRAADASEKKIEKYWKDRV